MFLFFVANSFGISKGIVTRDQPIGRQHIAPQRERSISVLSNHFVSSVRTVTNRAQDRVGDDVNDHGTHFVRVSVGWTSLDRFLPRAEGQNKARQFRFSLVRTRKFQKQRTR